MDAECKADQLNAAAESALGPTDPAMHTMAKDRPWFLYIMLMPGL
jgi:hypothetical protein